MMNFTNTLTTGLMVSLLGIILLFNSMTFGDSLATSWLTDQGGSDPDHFNIILKSYINIFIILGSVLFAFGLFFISFSFIKYGGNKGVEKQ
ncbi:hypothetical protein QUF84_20265 [Fictibacillus enclensis]|uniref:hypothetical protein n=1 Tax=Fictibacillus enclensis TaxID=1017270 RepID=UPI0025A082DB|nr:hypothetical protein [Fictibacillus enclensis]MDM5339538.1 hypothetical protein [Fictibacillus enclensis]